MTFQVIIQRCSKQKDTPSNIQIKKWALAALQNHCNSAEITIRIVNNKESAVLNYQYRGKAGPTNILSFVYEISPVHGDIVVCAPLIAQQAKIQQKPVKAHWSHLIVHGCLHLLGYDHIKLKDRKIMEKLEINILNKLGFENPY